MMEDDPDETEGRKLYRTRANALARAQVSMARRAVRLEETPMDWVEKAGKAIEPIIGAGIKEARKAAFLEAAAMAEEEAERQRGFADEAERKCMGGSAASHSSAGQLMAAFAARLRAEAGE